MAAAPLALVLAGTAEARAVIAALAPEAAAGRDREMKIYGAGARAAA